MLLYKLTNVKIIKHSYTNSYSCPPCTQLNTTLKIYLVSYLLSNTNFFSPRYVWKKGYVGYNPKTGALSKQDYHTNTDGPDFTFVNHFLHEINTSSYLIGFLFVGTYPLVRKNEFWKSDQKEKLYSKLYIKQKKFSQNKKYRDIDDITHNHSFSQFVTHLHTTIALYFPAFQDFKVVVPK